MSEIQQDDTFRVALRSRVYHADLLEAARRLGGTHALAKELGLSHTTVSNWILLKKFPSLIIPAAHGGTRVNPMLVKRWPEISKRLFEMTGKTTEQLFPSFVKLSGFLEAPKTTESVREISAGDLIGYQGARAMLPPPERDVDLSLLKDKLDTVLKTLTYREREVIKLRYGLGDGYTYTLEECARIFKVTRERLRQIEAKALRKLRDRAKPALESSFAAVLDLHPCPRCLSPCASFERCPVCDAVLCRDCLSAHAREKHAAD